MFILYCRCKVPLGTLCSVTMSNSLCQEAHWKHFLNSLFSSHELGHSIQGMQEDHQMQS